MIAAGKKRAILVMICVKARGQQPALSKVRFRIAGSFNDSEDTGSVASLQYFDVLNQRSHSSAQGRSRPATACARRNDQAG